jgi:uncharacterized RDD family membrane protein YckC
MGSALLNTETADSTFAPLPRESAAARPDAAALPGSAAALRLQAAERLAAHRSRRGTAQTRPAPEPARPATTRTARIAATVAERYAHTQTYRAFLAAEAERAVQQARAAAEIAALNAQAVAAAQQSLLDTFDQNTLEDAADLLESNDHNQPAPQIEFSNAEPHPVELNLWPDVDPAPLRNKQAVMLSEVVRNAKRVVEEPATLLHRPGRSHHSANEPASNLEPRALNPPLTVRLYEDATIPHVDLDPAHRTAPIRRPGRTLDRNDPEARALDEEIAFRQAPVFEEPAGPPMPLPANLIEFPRQLIASRKARPRLAEGPLRDDPGAIPADNQLRIFEVDPDQISITPAADSADDAQSAAAAPQWTSIWLDTPSVPARAEAPDTQTAPSASPQTAPLPQVASFGRRMLAAAINGAIVFSGLSAFAAAFVAVADHVLPWHPGPLETLLARTGLELTQLPAAIAIAGGLLLLLYQALFFWFGTATPGMRCARIALCTFDDENPTRKALRRRILAVLLSAFPLGLGFLWAALDEDRLAWHDRLSRTYQRSY